MGWDKAPGRVITQEWKEVRGTVVPMPEVTSFTVLLRAGSPSIISIMFIMCLWWLRASRLRARLLDTVMHRKDVVSAIREFIVWQRQKSVRVINVGISERARNLAAERLGSNPVSKWPYSWKDCWVSVSASGGFLRNYVHFYSDVYTQVSKERNLQWPIYQRGKQNMYVLDKECRERTSRSTQPLSVQSLDPYLGYSEDKDSGFDHV